MTHKGWDKIKETPRNFESFWIGIAENIIKKKCLYGKINMDTSVDTLDIIPSLASSTLPYMMMNGKTPGCPGINV